jgi:hypothetical protein
LNSKNVLLSVYQMTLKEPGSTTPYSFACLANSEIEALLRERVAHRTGDFLVLDYTQFPAGLEHPSLAPTAGLKPLQMFRVSLHEEAGDKHQLMFECLAPDEDTAETMAQTAYPRGVLLTTLVSPDAPSPVLVGVAATPELSSVVVFEGTCFVSEADSAAVSDDRVAELDALWAPKYPSGVLAVRAISCGADEDDVEELDEGGEQKVFVHIELHMARLAAIKAVNDPSSVPGLVAMLDELATELRADFSVCREDWSAEEDEEAREGATHAV